MIFIKNCYNSYTLIFKKLFMWLLHSPLPSIFWVIHIILVILAFFDIAKSNMSIVEKVVWALIIFFLPLIGLILYYVIAKD